MSVKVKTQSGKTITLLNPSEKAEKFAKELKHGVKRTNSGSFKLNKGKAIKLTPTEASYRSGYLDARQDNAKAYKSKKVKTKGR